MAKTIAICRGEDSSRVKEDHRLGSKRSVGEANTFRTFSGAEINADGSGGLYVSRGDYIAFIFTLTQRMRSLN